MRRNLIDFPPWRKSRGPLQDLAFLPQDLVLTSQTLQLGRQVLLPLRRRSLQITLAALFEPAAQRRKPNAEILGDLALRASARLHQTNGLGLEFHPEPAMRLAHEMLLFTSEELSSFARQVQIGAEVQSEMQSTVPLPSNFEAAEAFEPQFA